MDSRFKIVAYEPGAADVVDRASNERLGWVLADYWMEWEAFCVVCTGKSLGWSRLRSLAAERVWQHHQEEHA